VTWWSSATSDAARIRAFRHTLEDRVAEHAERFPWGTLISSPSIGDVYDVNFLRLDSTRRSAEALAALADDLQPHLFHRKVVVDRGGERLAHDFSRLGWTVTVHLVMAHRREPDRRVNTSSVREVSSDELRRVRRESALGSSGTEELGEHLAVVKRRVGEALPVRHFAVRAGRRIAGYCELRSDGRIAQIEDVNTLEAFRGRGLGRALVEHVLDAARRDHELVYLEALRDDWPRELYVKLGFEVVDERHLFLRPPHRLTALRVRTPRLELRLATRAELRELAEVAQRGIHPPEEMPFTVAWTDNASSPSFRDDFVAFHEGAVAAWRPARWTLNLVAFEDGRPVGTQAVGGRSFARTRRVDTGSWLGRDRQGRGLGTEMRAAALELAFARLGAHEAWSAAHDGNEASRRVSEKLGYTPSGTETHRPRGERVRATRLVRRRDGWRSPVPVEIEGLAPLLPLFGVAP
jgi:RimJ/RimL family protein N-acetyltransferase/predicted GNAT family acetyltransferase